MRIKRILIALIVAYTGMGALSAYAEIQNYESKFDNIQQEIMTITGKLQKTTESGGWIVTDESANRKYLLLNTSKYKTEPWFKEGTYLKITGYTKKDAPSIYMEGTPFIIESIVPDYCRSH